jgi:hypothetical protein
MGLLTSRRCAANPDEAGDESICDSKYHPWAHAGSWEKTDSPSALLRPDDEVLPSENIAVMVTARGSPRRIDEVLPFPNGDIAHSEGLAAQRTTLVTSHPEKSQNPNAGSSQVECLAKPGLAILLTGSEI